MPVSPSLGCSLPALAPVISTARCGPGQLHPTEMGLGSFGPSSPWHMALLGFVGDLGDPRH